MPKHHGHRGFIENEMNGTGANMALYKSSVGPSNSLFNWLTTCMYGSGFATFITDCKKALSVLIGSFDLYLSYPQYIN